eukprot:gb/GECG01014319.1/.p1 GENE.gb/GECG01014319.1/~~gb/GECG01014319.1/.p1  ORF type:complete len:1012 (+),score=101.89 gb/GECG01014319.1/:1-3036(+)
MVMERSRDMGMPQKAFGRRDKRKSRDWLGAFSVLLCLCMRPYSFVEANRLDSIASKQFGKVIVQVMNDSTIGITNATTGATLLHQPPGKETWGSVQASVWDGAYLSRYIYEGWAFRLGSDNRTFFADGLADVNSGKDTLKVTYKSTVPGLSFQLVFSGGNEEEVLFADLEVVEQDGRAIANDVRINRLSIGFSAMDGSNGEAEAYYGFGERFNTIDQRGKKLYCWTEDGGWGFGTELRLPKGSESTYAPMPWLLARRTRGYSYGVFANTTYRTDWDLGAGSSSLITGNDYVHEDQPTTAKGNGYTITVENTTSRLVFIFGEEPARTLSIFSNLNFVIDPASTDRPSHGHLRQPKLSRSSSGPVPGKGRALIPPPLMFGPWNQFGHELPGISNQTKAAAIFRERDIPSSVAIDPVHFFPDGDQRGKEAEIKRRNAWYASMGYKTVSYYNSMIDTTYGEAFNHTLKNGYLVKWRTPNTEHGKNGFRGTGGDVGPNDTYLFVYKGAGPNPFYCGLLDLTNPEAVSWFQQQFQEGIDLGYGGWMYDYGEYVDPNTSFANGLTGEEMHNAYPLVYQKAAWDFFDALQPREERMSQGYYYGPNYFYYVRSGYSGTQTTQYSHWTGDPSSDWTHHSGLPAQVSAMLNLGLSGVAYTGSDIGGFLWIEPPSAQLWIRWAQVGAFSGTMHVQGGGTSLFGAPKSTIHDTEEGSFIWRKFAKLRTALFPYIYSAAHTNQDSGLPLMRHPVLHFPADDVAAGLEYQWMFGNSFLVAPVLSPNTTSLKVYLPKSVSWFNFNDMAIFDNSSGRFRFTAGKLISGGQWRSVPAPLEQIPLFVVPGSVIFTADPAVDTLVTSHSPPKPPSLEDSQPSFQGSVVGFDDLRNVSHVWIFANERGSRDNIIGQGTSWDGVRVRFSSGTNGLKTTNFTLDLEDPYANARTTILQVILPVSESSRKPVNVYSGSGSELPKVSYEDLLWTHEANKTSPSTCWGDATDQNGVVWLRVGNTASSSSRQFLIEYA